jgi:hypothetical protein
LFLAYPAAVQNQAYGQITLSVFSNGAWSEKPIPVEVDGANINTWIAPAIAAHRNILYLAWVDWPSGNIQLALHDTADDPGTWKSVDFSVTPADADITAFKYAPFLISYVLETPNTKVPYQDELLLFYVGNDNHLYYSTFSGDLPESGEKPAPGGNWKVITGDIYTGKSQPQTNFGITGTVFGRTLYLYFKGVSSNDIHQMTYNGSSFGGNNALASDFSTNANPVVTTFQEQMVMLLKSPSGSNNEYPIEQGVYQPIIVFSA